jgi:vesicle coat complex subunit
MVDKVTVPTARASILWLIGEYSDRISKLAPDVLRKMAKSFPDEVCFQDLNFYLFNKLISLGNNC